MREQTSAREDLTMGPVRTASHHQVGAGGVARGRWAEVGDQIGGGSVASTWPLPLVPGRHVGDVLVACWAWAWRATRSSGVLGSAAAAGTGTVGGRYR